MMLPDGAPLGGAPRKQEMALVTLPNGQCWLVYYSTIFSERQFTDCRL
jgi:hypothetical protein